MVDILQILIKSRNIFIDETSSQIFVELKLEPISMATCSQEPYFLHSQEKSKQSVLSGFKDIYFFFILKKYTAM